MSEFSNKVKDLRLAAYEAHAYGVIATKHPGDFGDHLTERCKEFLVKIRDTNDVPLDEPTEKTVTAIKELIEHCKDEIEYWEPNVIDRFGSAIIPESVRVAVNELKTQIAETEKLLDTIN